MKLVYLAVGPNLANHFQAYFSILTFRRQPAALGGIAIVTDQPDFYRRLTGIADILPVDAATIQAWRGPHDYIWRIKIKALEAVAAANPSQDLLYLDADTVLHGDATQLAAQLQANTALMHEAEGPLATLPSRSTRQMWQQMGGRTFAGLPITPQRIMWNAGVVGIPARRVAATLTLALRLCDEFCAAAGTPHVMEQFAMSVALAETGPLAAAAPHIGHYWSTKPEWNAAIQPFLLTSLLQNRSVAEEVAALAAFNFAAQPVKQQVRNTRWRLEKLVQRLFPARQVSFLEASRNL